MKRFAALLIAGVLLLSTTALAFTGEGYPAWDGASTPENTCCGIFGGERISLSFDPADDYSNLLDGVIQACFFAYDASETNFLELYLLIPEDVTPGDVLRNGDGRDCSIYLYETSIDSEALYFAGDLNGVSTVNVSDFELTIESAQVGATAIRMAGRLTARLCRFDREQPQMEQLEISDARFSFTLPLFENPFAPTPGPGGGIPGLPEDSSPALPDSPKLTLPPFYVTI